MRQGQEMKINKKFIIGFTIVIVVASSIFGYYIYTSLFPETDDAYINAHTIDIAPRIEGFIKSINVENNQYVHEGDLLLEIDPADYQLQLAEAKQNYLIAKQKLNNAAQQITTAETNVRKTTSDYEFAQQMAERYQHLFENKAGSMQDMQKYDNQKDTAFEALEQAKISLENSNTQYQIAQSEIEIAKTKIDNSKLNLSYTKIYAAVDGFIGNLNLQRGQLVSAGQKLFVLVDDHKWWVDVNLKETQLSRIKPGQPAKIELDMYSHTFHGTVESISPASGTSFSLLPAQNASGNWVKVTQRFTVRVKVEDDPKYPLRIGASAVVSINTLDS